MAFSRSVLSEPDSYEQFTDINCGAHTDFWSNSLPFPDGSVGMTTTVKQSNLVGEMVAVGIHWESRITMGKQKLFGFLQLISKCARCRCIKNTREAIVKNSLCKAVGTIDDIEVSIASHCLRELFKIRSKKVLKRSGHHIEVRCGNSMSKARRIQGDNKAPERVNFQPAGAPQCGRSACTRHEKSRAPIFDISFPGICFIETRCCVSNCSYSITSSSDCTYPEIRRARVCVGSILDIDDSRAKRRPIRGTYQS